jgi:hypothetical protein
VCQKRGNALDQLGIDVAEAGLRSVIQWLLWLFGLPESYKSTKELVSQLLQWVRQRVIKALEDQACFGKMYDFKEESKSVYVLSDECKMGVPIERDCGGVIPGIFKQWEDKGSKHRQVPRQERAKMLGIRVEKEEILEEGRKEEKEEEEEEEDEGVETYMRVLKEDSYVVPKRFDVVEAIEKLFLKEEGDFAESSSGVELVCLQLSFSDVVEAGSESYGTYDVSKDPLIVEKTVRESVNLGLSLLPEEGVMIMVAPFGLPEWWVEGSGSEDPSVGAKASIRCRTLFVITADDEVRNKNCPSIVCECRRCFADGRQTCPVGL